MFARIILATIMIIILAANPVSADRQKTWYETGYKGPVPSTLQQALTAERTFLDGNPHWKHVNATGLKEVCTAFKSVGLSCDYNTRGTVSMFLTINGKGLFPAKVGTNPYCTPEDREAEIQRGGESFPDDCFIGESVQNKMLAASIRRNAGLFQRGDITADRVKTQWR